MNIALIFPPLFIKKKWKKKHLFHLKHQVIHSILLNLYDLDNDLITLNESPLRNQQEP